jgi:GMP synthase (glutamine-hydrolysing)
MRLHYLQHVPFEDPANIAVWAEKRGHSVSGTALHDGQQMPATSQFDWLVILGGPMNVYEEQEYPWLAAEKRLIAEAIAQKMIVIGICLGAQLIADVLGARVYRNSQPEIGWFPVSLTEKANASPVFKGLPCRFNAFHWHGDTFDIPAGAIGLARSDACVNQAFMYGQRVIGLQFHLESTMSSIRRLIENSQDEGGAGKYVQTPREMLAPNARFGEIENILDTLLDNLDHQG